jgi:hypothetical protein
MLPLHKQHAFQHNMMGCRFTEVLKYGVFWRNYYMANGSAQEVQSVALLTPHTSHDCISSIALRKKVYRVEKQDHFCRNGGKNVGE